MYDLLSDSKVNEFTGKAMVGALTKDEQFVYGVLCPERVALNSYDAAPIPLRILQVAAHAQSLGMFKHLYVWDKASQVVKDPVLVAYTGQYYFSPDHIFILARWGDELETFATLLKRAIAAKREALIQQAESMLGKVRSMTDAEMIVAGAGAEVKL